MGGSLSPSPSPETSKNVLKRGKAPGGRSARSARRRLMNRRLRGGRAGVTELRVRAGSCLFPGGRPLAGSGAAAPGGARPRGPAAGAQGASRPSVVPPRSPGRLGVAQTWGGQIRAGAASHLRSTLRSRGSPPSAVCPSPSPGEQSPPARRPGHLLAPDTLAPACCHPRAFALPLPPGTAPPPPPSSPCSSPSGPLAPHPPQRPSFVHFLVFPYFPQPGCGLALPPAASCWPPGGPSQCL